MNDNHHNDHYYDNNIVLHKIELTENQLRCKILENVKNVGQQFVIIYTIQCISFYGFLFKWKY